MLLIQPHLQIPCDELRFEFVRSSGPGGQNVNKVSTKAVLRWNVVNNRSLPDAVRARFLARFRTRVTAAGEVMLASQRFRDRRRNIQDCLDRLEAMVASVAVPPKRRKPTRPTAGAVRRRLEAKRARSQRKQQRRASGWQE